MSAEDHRWHYDYARLAWDSGFTFQTHRLKPSLDKNVGHIDVDQVIRERDVATIEKHISTVIEYSLDNDQTSVLDPTFVKIFRLSQLSVQYLIFCKKYLDNTVALIKTEFTRNNEEIKNLKHYVDELQQELTNSKIQIKELKTALSCQIASTQHQPIYQCNDCPKAFSTEEYLLAHIKRRHNILRNVASSATSFQAETDKLQLEIKELKERLNNTEKFIHNEEPGKSPREIIPVSNVSSRNNTVENTLLADLQQRFEFLRTHVENELRLLQTQKFDQEKYEQWFETFLNKLEQVQSRKVEKNSNLLMEANLSNVNLQKKYSELEERKQLNDDAKENLNDIKRNDSTTQTEAALPYEDMVCINCQTKHSSALVVAQAEQPGKQNHNNVGDAENIKQKIRSETEIHLGKFEEMINHKITGSIEKLENQMQSFWNKMNEIETQKLQAVDPVLKEQQNRKTNASLKSINVEAQRKASKPRKRIPSTKETNKSSSQPKLNQHDVKTTPNPKNIKNFNLKKLSKAQPTQEIIILKEANVNFNSDAETESELSEESVSSESSEEEEESKESSIKHQDNVISKPSYTSTLGQRSLTSLKQAAFTPEVMDGLQKEIENLLNNRLEEIGISSEWSTLPLRSYKRALSIIDQQVSILHKDIPNYTHIRSRILKNVDKQALEKKTLKSSPQKPSRLKNLLNNVKSKAKGIIQNESKPTFARQQPPKPKLQKTSNVIPKQEQDLTREETSKAKMYMTDSESESSIRNRKTWNPPKPLNQTQKAYHDVIRELNTTVASKMKDHDESISEISESTIHSDIPSNKNEVEAGNNVPIKTETQAKSVLKNYPSVGSLHKKKVLFDLDSSKSEQKNSEKPEIINKVNDGGSTTSVASSVLDGSKTNLAQKSSDIKQNELSDISDWDLSDVLN